MPPGLLTPSPSRRATRARRERGLTQSVQWALLTPVVVLAVLGTIQAAIIYQAQEVARQAAAAGAEAESWYGAQTGSGAAVAERVADGGGLKNTQVRVKRRGGLAVVTVSGRADVFLDLGQGRVTRTATFPLEEP